MPLALQVLNGERPVMPDRGPLPFRRIIREGWNENPERRPTAAQVCVCGLSGLLPCIPVADPNATTVAACGDCGDSAAASGTA